VPYIHHTISLILEMHKMLKMDKATTALALEKLSAR
jgi:hypothetical protein